MGRKSTHDDAKRDKVVSTRLREDTYDRLTAAAKKAGLSRAGYLEHLIENRELKVQSAPSDALPITLVNELKRIGNNLNQMAHSVHCEMSPPQAEILAAVAELMRTIASNEVLQRRLTAAIEADSPAEASPAVKAAWRDMGDTVADMLELPNVQPKPKATPPERASDKAHSRPAAAAVGANKPVRETGSDVRLPAIPTPAKPWVSPRATEAGTLPRPPRFNAYSTPLPIPAAAFSSNVTLPPLFNKNPADLADATGSIASLKAAAEAHRYQVGSSLLVERGTDQKPDGGADLTAPAVAKPLPFSLLDLLSGREPVDRRAFDQELDCMFEEAFPHAASKITLPKSRAAKQVQKSAAAVIDAGDVSPKTPAYKPAATAADKPAMAAPAVVPSRTFLPPGTYSADSLNVEIIKQFDVRTIPHAQFYDRCGPIIVPPLTRACRMEVRRDGILFTDEAPLWTRCAHTAWRRPTPLKAVFGFQYDVLGNAYGRKIAIDEDGNPQIEERTYTPRWSIFKSTYFVPRPKP
jgi:hypothetical protein